MEKQQTLEDINKRWQQEMSIDNELRKLKDGILTGYQEIFAAPPHSKKAIDAFLDVDRHFFIDHYYKPNGNTRIELTSDNVDECIQDLYADTFLTTEVDDLTGERLSSISQPSLVIYMHALLDIKEGDRVLEIGTGTGWSAAMLSNMVGIFGSVVSYEIMPELARKAQAKLDSSTCGNVTVRVGDGVRGEVGREFDAVIFTVGTYDIPVELYDQVKEGGVLVLVLKTKGGSDTLIKFRRTGTEFISERALPCRFVQVQGEFRLAESQPEILSKSEKLKKLWERAIPLRPFWFAGTGKNDFFWRSAAFRAFLQISEPNYYIFSDVESFSGPTSEEIYFGVVSFERESLAVFRREKLYVSGSNWASNRIEELLRQWVDMGMPTLASFKISASKRRTLQESAFKSGSYALTQKESEFRFHFQSELGSSRTAGQHGSVK